MVRTIYPCKSTEVGVGLSLASLYVFCRLENLVIVLCWRLYGVHYRSMGYQV